MDVVVERCCGLDVHKKTVVACRILPDEAGRPQKEVRTFGTMTGELLSLSDWLKDGGVTHVAMEATGVYWKPVYNLLEGNFELLVVNAQHIKAVPGRKTDVKDAEWIADLLRHGLLKGSFIPDAPQRELRELTRHRQTLVEERAHIVNRLLKVLEEANIKLGSVVSDIQGKSARLILDAVLKGESDPETLSELAVGRLKGKREALAQAVEGRVRPHHRLLIGQHLDHLDFLSRQIAAVSEEIEQRLRPFDEAIQRLDEIPGVNRRIAEVILSEVGSDMSRFASSGHLASWAGMCPGNCESAGKRKSGKTRKGSPALRQALVEAAHGASHSKETYLQAQFHRLRARRGAKRAWMAVGHSILVIAYHLLKDPSARYQNLGGNYFDERNRTGVERRLVRRLEQLGYHVSLQSLPSAA
jgi:transposase